MYGIIELRGLMAAASLIWLSPLPHATCPNLTQAALANVKVLCKVFLCCSYCTLVAATCCCCWSVAAVVIVVGAASIVVVLVLLLLL